IGTDQALPDGKAALPMCPNDVTVPYLHWFAEREGRTTFAMGEPRESPNVLHCKGGNSLTPCLLCNADSLLRNRPESGSRTHGASGALRSYSNSVVLSVGGRAVILDGALPQRTH